MDSVTQIIFIFSFLRNKVHKKVFDVDRIKVPESDAYLEGCLHFLDSFGCTSGRIWEKICNREKDNN